MGYNIGPKIGIDGEAEFRRQIQNINQAYKTLTAETRAVTAAYEAADDEQGKMKASAAQLRKEIDMQNQKFKLLEDAVKKASDKYGENSAEATRLKGVLFDTKATVSKLEGELRSTEKKLDDTGDAMSELGDETDNAGESMVSFGEIMSANLVSDLVLDGLRAVGSEMKNFATGSITAAQDIIAENAQFEQSFGSLQEQARNNLQGVEQAVGVAATRMQGIYTKTYAFAKTAGATSAEALNMSGRAMIAAADNAAYYDKSMEEATEQLQSFLKGNYANDAALGIAATETTRNAKANELYAKSFNKLTESQKVDVLLSMVEAGNKASGAIGQAARESDSWANVNGELTEMLRQLQGEAGKPALQKMVPVIKKITAAGYELIDSVDWDAFGDTVVGVADGVIKATPGVLRAIAAITAGIVAMKITEKIQSLVKMGSSFLSLGSAATTAGNAVAASGAVASATPWGAVAALIGTAATAIIVSVKSAKTATSELESAMEKFESSINRANENFENQKEEIAGSAYAAEHYVDRLRQIEQAGLDTAEAQEEYRLTVEQLNEVMPDLNLQIDEQTGLLNKNLDAIDADIEAWKRNATQKALQAKYTDVLEAQGKAQAELLETKAKLNILEKDGADLEERRKGLMDQISAATSNAEQAQRNLSAAYQGSGMSVDEAERKVLEANQAVQTLNEQYGTLSEEIRQNTDEQDAMSHAISNAEETVKSYETELTLAQESVNMFNQEVNGTGDAYAKEQLAIEDVQAALDNLNLEYDEAVTAAKNSIDSQIGLFDELSMKSDWSAAKIIENWKSQQAAFANYEENLKKAVDLGLDETLVKQLSDGSQESMLILDALVNDTSISIDEINKEFATTEESRVAVSETMGAIQADVENKMDDIKTAAENSGVEIVNGAARGINSNISIFEAAMRSMAKRGTAEFRNRMEIRSPSRVMARESGYVVEGAEKGIENKTWEFERSMDELAARGVKAYQVRAARAMDYPAMLQAQNSQTITQNSKQYNYGDITIPIYQQPGENAEMLAERVMEVIDQKISEREAAM